MVGIELFSEPEVDELLRVFRDVSKIPPAEVLSYLIELSEAVLGLYILMRDSLPKDYGRIKFSRFVEKKRKQVEGIRSIMMEMYPGARIRGHDISLKFDVETVQDYSKVLEDAIQLESLSLRVLRHLVESSDNKILLNDIAQDIEDNIRELQRELDRLRKFESKARFSEFVKELVGDRDG
ncbi:hypothetical protein [Thermococcus thermotolerans]|uniref:hypothetical protein n=1 Tax=Thermococcus thermotolerans TaxID=2969672 RepID=UPI0021570B12|nr:hypothetical protein [Thermococcus thermotolerans]